MGGGVGEVGGAVPLMYWTDGLEIERIETVFTLSEKTNDPRSASRIHRVDDTLRRRVCAAQSVGSTVFETRLKVCKIPRIRKTLQKNEEVGETFGAE